MIGVGSTVNCPFELVMLFIIKADVPVLVTVTDLVLSLPNTTFPKFKLFGFTENLGETPLPLTTTVDLMDDAL